MYRYVRILILGVTLLGFYSCISNAYVFDQKSAYLSCNLELVIPTANGVERVNGVIRVLKDECIQVSLRAPMLRSEVAFLEYRTDSLTVVDRKNKLFANSGFPIKYTRGIYILSLMELQNVLFKASTSKKKNTYLLASEFGWTLFDRAVVRLWGFKSERFELRNKNLPKKYSETSLDTLLYGVEQ